MSELDPETRAACTDAASVAAEVRRRIAAGQYTAGMRLAETATAEALGVSRTPVRLAFRTLEQEGLLQPAGKRGYMVRGFSDQDVLCAIEVRGVLEGLAARRLAERGLSAALRNTLMQCITDGRELLAADSLSEARASVWGQINARFHGAILAAEDSPVIADAITRNDHLPFASAGSIIIDTGALDRELQKLRFAQLQHELVLQALEKREGARVESLMREHAYVGVRYGKLFGLNSVERFDAHR